MVEHPKEKFGRFKLKAKTDTRVVVELAEIAAPTAHLIFPFEDKKVLEDIGLGQQTIWPLKLTRLRLIETLKSEGIDLSRKRAEDFTTPNPDFFDKVLNEESFDKLLHEYSQEPYDEEYPETEVESIEGMTETSLRQFIKEMGKESGFEVTPRKCPVFNFL